MRGHVIVIRFRESYQRKITRKGDLGQRSPNGGIKNYSREVHNLGTFGHDIAFRRGRPPCFTGFLFL
jgi:hypothetical protein